MTRDIILFLEDILENINLIENSLGQISKSLFQTDLDKRDATLRRLEIIGESVKNIPEEFRKKYPKVLWKDIAGFRDILTHAYFGVDFEKVWEVVKEDLPKLKTDIKKIKNDLENS